MASVIQTITRILDGVTVTESCSFDEGRWISWDLVPEGCKVRVTRQRTINSNRAVLLREETPVIRPGMAGVYIAMVPGDSHGEVFSGGSMVSIRWECVP